MYLSNILTVHASNKFPAFDPNSEKTILDSRLEKSCLVRFEYLRNLSSPNNWNSLCVPRPALPHKSTTLLELDFQIPTLNGHRRQPREKLVRVIRLRV